MKTVEEIRARWEGRGPWGATAKMLDDVRTLLAAYDAVVKERDEATKRARIDGLREGFEIAERNIDVRMVNDGGGHYDDMSSCDETELRKRIAELESGS